ncbi:MAG: hypothetical protein JXB47_06725 [Anaerolineae bacterium]|nr:hypothetical protein [Anaerolineae bacterium]
MVKLESLKSIEAADIVRQPQIADGYPYYMVLHETTASGSVNYTVQAINLLYERGWRVVGTAEHYGVGLSKNNMVFYITLERKPPEPPAAPPRAEPRQASKQKEEDSATPRLKKISSS